MQPNCVDPFNAGGAFATNCNMLENPSKAFRGFDNFSGAMNGPAKGCIKLSIEANGNGFEINNF